MNTNSSTNIRACRHALGPLGRSALLSIETVTVRRPCSVVGRADGETNGSQAQQVSSLGENRKGNSRRSETHNGELVELPFYYGQVVILRRLWCRCYPSTSGSRCKSTPKPSSVPAGWTLHVASAIPSSA